MELDREQLVLYLLEHVTPLIRQYASSALPFEDAYQSSSIEVLQLVDRKEQITGGLDGLRAMTYVRVRGALLNMLARARKRSMISLDAPLSSDGDAYSLADLLPDPYAVEPPTVLLAKEQLEEMRSLIQRVKHNQTRRKCSALQASAFASLSY